MKITGKDVEYVETLARLRLTKEERVEMAEQLSGILTYVEKLNELDTQNVEPMAQVLAEAHPETALREDTERPGLPHEAAVKPAPDADDTYVKVPKVIER